MGTNPSQQIEQPTARRQYSVSVPDEFVLEDEFAGDRTDFEDQGDPASFEIDTGEPLSADQFATEIPEGFMLQTDDIFEGRDISGGEEAAFRAAKPLGLIDRAKRAFTDILEGGEIGRKKRTDLVFTMAKKNKLPLSFVDENLESLLKVPALTEIRSIPEARKPAIAFSQSLVEAFTFGAFDPDEVIKAKFPVRAAAGSVIGGVALFITTGNVLGALGLTATSVKAGQAGQAIFSAAPRFLPPAIMTGSTFATVKGIDEAVRQVEEKDINLLAVGKETMIGFTEGFGLGAIGQTVGFTRRIFMAGGLGYVSGKVQGYSNTEAALQGTIWGGIEALGGIGRDEALKQRVVANTRDKLAQYAKTKDPSLSIKASIEKANQFLSRMAQGNLNKAVKETPIKFMEKANKIVSDMIKNWKGVKNVDVLGTELRTNKELAKAIIKPVADVGVPAKGLGAKKAFSVLKIDPKGKPVEGGKITVVSTAGKKDAGKTIGQESNQTGLEGIHQETLDVITNLSEKHGLAITITGGTEAGHKEGEISHATGRKIDLRLQDDLNKVIESWESAGTRDFDNAPGFVDPDSNAIFYKEGNHWDVEVPISEIEPEIIKEQPSFLDVPEEQPLIEEAKKFKTAEEFVAAQPKIYHGTGADFDVFSKSVMGRTTGATSAKEGFFFSNNPYVSANYVLGSLYNKEGFSNIRKTMVKAYTGTPTEKFIKFTKQAERYREKINSMPVFEKIKDIEGRLLPKAFKAYKGNLIEDLEKLNSIIPYKLDIRTQKEKTYKNVYFGDTLVGRIWDVPENQIIFTQQLKPLIKAIDSGIFAIELAKKMGVSEPIKEVALTKGLREKTYNADIRKIKLPTAAKKKAGYDVMVFKNIKDPGIKATNYTVFNPEHIKTTQQLTDIWNKAHEKPLAASEEAPPPARKPVKPLLTQAQKQKRAKKRAKREKQEQIKVSDVQSLKEKAIGLVRQRRAEIDLGNFETNLFLNDLEQVLTKDQRNAMIFVIEDTPFPDKLDDPGAKAVLEKDREALKPIAAQIKENFDRGWKFMRENMDNFTAEQKENYVTHLWKLSKKQPEHNGKNAKKALITNTFVTKNKFLKKRVVDTYKLGIDEFGLIPRTTDIIDIIRTHDNIMHKTIANNKLVEGLRKLKLDGLTLIERVDLAPEEWIYFDHPAINKALVIPGELVRGEKISDEMIAIFNELGFVIGRRIAPKVFGKAAPLGTAAFFKDPPEIRLQRFFTTRTLAHEIGHLLDAKLGLGGVKPGGFANTYKNEIYALNRKRIELFKGRKGKYGQQYAESAEEQIAEFFSFLFADPETAYKLAPNATSAMMRELRKDGALTKLVDLDFENKAKNLIEEQLNTLVKLPVKVHPELEKPLRVVFDRRINHPIINAYQAFNGVLKKMQLSISLFHVFALGETSIATMGIKETVKIALNFPRIYRALAKGEFDVFAKADSSRKWIKRGLQLGATADIPVAKIQQALNNFAKDTKNIPILKNATEFLSTFNELWDKALWNYYHDTLKLYAAEHLASRIDPDGNIEKQEQEIAQMVNDTFGGQNWDTLLVSPKTLQIASWALLSPDWTLSTVRQAMSPTGAGALFEESRALRAKLGRMFWLKAMLYFGVGINLLNAVNRRKDMKENPQFYEIKDFKMLDHTLAGNAIGHKTHLFAGRYKDGAERYIRWGKQFREVPELFMDDLGFSPVSATIKKLGGKASPGLQTASTIFTGHTLSGFEIREISESEGWERTWATVKQLLKTPLPFSARNLIDDQRESFISDIAMPSSKGMTRFKAIKLFKLGIMRNDERTLKEVFQDVIDNNLPANTLLIAASTAIKAEKTGDLKSKIRTVEDIDKALEKVTDDRDKIRLTNQKRRMLKEQAEIKAVLEGMNLFEKQLLKIQKEFGF